MIRFEALGYPKDNVQRWLQINQNDIEETSWTLVRGSHNAPWTPAALGDEQGLRKSSARIARRPFSLVLLYADGPGGGAQVCNGGKGVPASWGGDLV